MLPRFSKPATPPRHRDLWSLWRGEPATPATRRLRLTPSGSGKPAPRRAAHPRLATVAKSRGSFDESTPTQGSATATTPRRALRPAAVPAPGLSPPPRHPPPPTLHSAAPVLPPRLPHKLLPPSSCPSNKFASSLFAHDFSFNYYKTINIFRNSGVLDSRISGIEVDLLPICGGGVQMEGVEFLVSGERFFPTGG